MNLTASESDAHAMARRADTDYVLVISGVLVGFEADDIFFAAKPPPPSSLLHRLAHYRVGEVDGTPRDIGRFEEAFTSANFSCGCYERCLIEIGRESVKNVLCQMYE